MPSQPNILFILSDEHSFRAMGHLPDPALREPVNTPTFDRLAASGTVYEQTYCQVSLCTPSRLCMLTGHDPRQSGGWHNNMMINPDRPTIASTLSEAGYTTALIGKMHLGGNRQFAGFQHRPYGDLTGRTGHQGNPKLTPNNPPYTGMAMRSRTVDACESTIPQSLLQEQVVATETIAFLRDHQHASPDKPWFVCASVSRPHFPLQAPKRFFDRYWPHGVTKPKVGREGDTAQHPMTQGMAKTFRTEEIDRDEMLKARAGYFACVDYLDEMIGDMLATLERDGLLDNTVIIYTSDHGELMGEHGMWWKNSWHEGATRVPWIIQTPEHRRGQTPRAALQQPVSLADLYPTICGFAGVTPPSDLPGADLSPCVADGSEPAERAIMSTNPIPRWGKGTEHIIIRKGRYKYVRFRGEMTNLLFDLEADPFEQRNLVDAPAHADAASELAAIAQQQWDFDEAARLHEQWAKVSHDNDLKLATTGPTHSGNLYHLPDGRLVNAEDPLYAPTMPIEDPASAIADWPR